MIDNSRIISRREALLGIGGLVLAACGTACGTTKPATDPNKKPANKLNTQLTDLVGYTKSIPEVSGVTLGMIDDPKFCVYNVCLSEGTETNAQKLVPLLIERYKLGSYYVDGRNVGGSLREMIEKNIEETILGEKPSLDFGVVRFDLAKGGIGFRPGDASLSPYEEKVYKTAVLFQSMNENNESLGIYISPDSMAGLFNNWNFKTNVPLSYAIIELNRDKEEKGKKLRIPFNTQTV